MNFPSIKQINIIEYVKILAREHAGHGACSPAEIVNEEQHWVGDDVAVELEMSHPVAGKSFFRFYVTFNGRPYAFRDVKKFYLFHGEWKYNAFKTCLIWE